MEECKKGRSKEGEEQACLQVVRSLSASLQWNLGFQRIVMPTFQHLHQEHSQFWGLWLERAPGRERLKGGGEERGVRERREREEGAREGREKKEREEKGKSYCNMVICTLVI